MPKSSSIVANLREVYSFPSDTGDSLSETENFFCSYIPQVKFLWSTRSKQKTPFVYGTGIIIVLQGQKVGYLGDRVFHYDEDNYLVLSVPVPIECSTHASEEHPLLGVMIDFEITTLYEISMRVQKTVARKKSPDNVQVPSGVEPAAMDEELRDVVARLLNCLKSKEGSDVLGPGIVTEIIYRVLSGVHGEALYSLTQQSTHFARIASVLNKIHNNCSSPLTVEHLAEDIGMSNSAFHRAFKQVTSDSPIQYIKKIRLNRAKMLLAQGKDPISEVARSVGYENISQFSREFKRYFGIPPSECRRQQTSR